MVDHYWIDGYMWFLNGCSYIKIKHHLKIMPALYLKYSLVLFTCRYSVLILNLHFTFKNISLCSDTAWHSAYSTHLWIISYSKLIPSFEGLINPYSFLLIFRFFCVMSCTTPAWTWLKQWTLHFSEDNWYNWGTQQHSFDVVCMGSSVMWIKHKN